MRCAVCHRETRSVYHNAYGKILQSNIVNYIIVSALKERGVDRNVRLIACGREACRKSKRVRFRNSDVEVTLGEAFTKGFKTGSYAHSRSYRHDLLIDFCLLYQSVGQNVMEGLAFFVSVLYAMELCGRTLCGSKALAFYGSYMDYSALA